MAGDEGTSDEEGRDTNQLEETISPTISSNPENIVLSSIEDFDASLPETVELLYGPNGSKLYLIGTAHFSKESQEDVSRVIQNVKPHMIVVELCKSRSLVLKMDEKTLEEEAKNLSFEKMMNIIKEQGSVQGMLTIILLNTSAQLARDLGMGPGGEFRTAFVECQKLKRCIFHFGDRPIQITLKRALEVLSWWQRIRLSFSLVFQSPKVSKEEIEKYKQRDLLESLLAEIGNEYPELRKVLIDERDLYLTYSMQLSCSVTLDHEMLGVPKEEVDPVVVVGVVGMGHVPGIKANWGKVQEHQIDPIMTVKEGKPRSIFKRVIIASLLTYAAFKLIRRFQFSPRKFFNLKWGNSILPVAAS